MPTLAFNPNWQRAFLRPVRAQVNNVIANASGTVNVAMPLRKIYNRMALANFRWSRANDLVEASVIDIISSTTVQVQLSDYESGAGAQRVAASGNVSGSTIEVVAWGI